MKRLAIVVACVTLGACRRAEPATAKYELRDVFRAEIARLEAAHVEDEAPLPTPDADTTERVKSLVLDRAHDRGKLRALALQQLATEGRAAIPVAEAILDDPATSSEEKVSAIETLGAIDDPRCASALARHVNIEKDRDAWVRSQAARQLAGLVHSDHVIPRITSVLKYETDGETVIWIAAFLARHADYAGLDGLRVLAANAVNEEIREHARTVYADLAREAGCSDGEQLYAVWWGLDRSRTLRREEPSPRLRLEIWRCVSRLAEFDLRLVDDARFALSRGAPWVVDVLVEALHEQDTHVRLHVTQCLERMAKRASGACPELVHALDEPETAAVAAAALGSIGCADALAPLEARTSPKSSPEMRAAAAAALGKLGDPSATPALERLVVETEPLDLRQTAAQALLALHAPKGALALLVECLTRPGADASAAEVALESWLQSVSARDAAARDALAEWSASASPPDAGTPTAEETRARQKKRAAALRPRIDALVSTSGGR